MTTLLAAIARHRAAQAALDAVPSDEELPDDLLGEFDEALNALAETPCANDAEFIEKLRYLATEYDVDDCDCAPFATAARCYFAPSDPE